MDVTYDVTYESTFNGYPINTDKDKEIGCYTKGLARLQNEIESMTAKHNKVLITGVILRYPQDGSIQPSSKDFNIFNKNLKRDLERNNILPKEGKLRGTRRTEPDKTPKNQVDPSITIVCEQHGEDKNTHAHVLIMVNGNAKRDPFDIHKRASRAWKSAIGVENVSGLVHCCERSHLLNRSSPDFQQEVNDAFHHSSYLFKVRGKEHRHKGSWMIHGTRCTPIQINLNTLFLIFNFNLHNSL